MALPRPEDLHTTEQAAEALGIPASVIRKWKTRLLVMPADYLTERVRGDGRRPLYSLDELRPRATAYQQRMMNNMTAPTRPVPTHQQQAFGLAAAEHLGVDPTTASMNAWRADDEHGVITLDFHLPVDDLLHLFNTGTVPDDSPRPRAAALEVLAEMERHAPLPNPAAYYAMKLRAALGVTGPLTCSCGACKAAETRGSSASS